MTRSAPDWRQAHARLLHHSTPSMKPLVYIRHPFHASRNTLLPLPLALTLYSESTPLIMLAELLSNACNTSTGPRPICKTVLSSPPSHSLPEVLPIASRPSLSFSFIAGRRGSCQFYSSFLFPLLFGRVKRTLALFNRSFIPLDEEVPYFHKSIAARQLQALSIPCRYFLLLPSEDLSAPLTKDVGLHLLFGLGALRAGICSTTGQQGSQT